MRPLFYAGWHQPSDAALFSRAMFSVNRLEHRRSDFYPNDWILDSGAFTRIATGRGHMPVEDYARQIDRWSRCGNLQSAVSQDYMCEPFILGLAHATVAEHQALTIARYDALLRLCPSAYVMPVIQGFRPAEYIEHLGQYGERLQHGAWVGVGSVCKRNGSPWLVHEVLSAIKVARPDLRLHGFGLKKTALTLRSIQDSLYSCDSMASSRRQRYEGNGNDPRAALAYADEVATVEAPQGVLL